MIYKKIFNYFMKQFLIDNGFHVALHQGRELHFKHKNFDNAEIRFHFFLEGERFKSTNFVKISNHIETIVSGGNYPCRGMYLTSFVNGIKKFDDERLLQGLYFDNEEEFLGVLEYQANLFSDWVFDWMLCKKYTDINLYDIHEKKENEYIKWFDNLDKENQRKILNETETPMDKWKKRRFYPQKWSLESMKK